MVPVLCVVCGARPVMGDGGRCYACAEAASHWPRDFRSPKVAAVVAVVLLVLSGLLAAGVLVADVLGVRAVGLVLADADDVEGYDLLDSLAALETATNGASLFLLLVTAVSFVVWFRRIRANADLFVPNGHRLGSGWAIGAWFTPLVGLWFPWQLVVDCWLASGPVDPEGRRRTVSHWLVSAWWTTWTGSLLAPRIARALVRTGPGVDEEDLRLEAVRTALQVEVVGNALRVAAAVLAVLVVWRLTEMQIARAAVARRPGARPVPPQEPFGTRPVSGAVS
ncbi:DUF4328 domain-containing protein [Streptomyces sp. TLI_053]|uniref:DUF4328 domain-containing protein n=1 Tax=Streptomyces sp. TLI_053 TaxID=1855352 RepID=UPI0013520CC2|nr:DUF4328 domain-containing protein [Streptomyces sp. TLI_053]